VVLVLDEVRETRDAMRYGYAVGKVRVLETRALDRPALERLLDARTFPQQKRLLAETSYARHLETAETPEQVENALDEALSGFYKFMEEAALPEPVVRFFRLRYDYANLKAALKSLRLEASVSGLLVDHGTVEAHAFQGELDALPGELGTLAASLREASGVSEIDAAVDRAYFARLYATARAARSGFLEDLASLSIDIANLKTLVRGRLAGRDAATLSALFIENGNVSTSEMAELSNRDVAQIAPALQRLPSLRPLSGLDLLDPAVLDPAAEVLMAAALRTGRQTAAGPEPVIAYVMGREAEVRMLRVLLLGTLTGIDYETLRSRLSAAFR